MYAAGKCLYCGEAHDHDTLACMLIGLEGLTPVDSERRSRDFHEIQASDEKYLDAKARNQKFNI